MIPVVVLLGILPVVVRVLFKYAHPASLSTIMDLVVNLLAPPLIKQYSL